MSFSLRLSSLTSEQRLHILKFFTVRCAVSQYDKNPPQYRCFLADATTDELKLPLGMWKDYVKDISIGEDFFPNGNLNDFPKMSSGCILTFTLLTADSDPSGRNRDQDVVADVALTRLKEEGSVFIATHTGFGKMALGIYLSVTLKLKTLIVCHLDVVRNQWPDEYNKFSKNVKIQFIKGKIIDAEADVYIVGIKKLANMISSGLDVYKDFLSTIGTIIVDEAHISTVTLFTECLLHISPRYLVGLSATPDRNDGLHSLFNLYFGDTKEFITRHEVKDFTVYKLQTKYEPNVRYINIMGETRLDWNEAVRSVEENPALWKEVAELAVKHYTSKIIILCNRNALANGVYNLLVEWEADVELLIGSKRKYNTKARILVAGIKKGGVGLNDPELTMAIIASDVTDVRQIEGRVRTTNNIIYHLVHNYKTFENHWVDCEKWYQKRGANIEVVGVKHEFLNGKNSSILDRKLLVNSSPINKKISVSVIGTAKGDFTKNMFDKMVNKTVDIIENIFNLNMNDVELVSGGAAWSDHCAVSLFLQNRDGHSGLNQRFRCQSLSLFFPCEWDFEKVKFVDSGINDWKTNPGGLANYYHKLFTEKRGLDKQKNSLKEIDEAIKKGATYEVHMGFHNRNLKVAKSDYLIAFSWSNEDHPLEGGTKHTWDNCKNKKYHVSLSTL